MVVPGGHEDNARAGWKHVATVVTWLLSVAIFSGVGPKNGHLLDVHSASSEPSDETNEGRRKLQPLQEKGINEGEKKRGVSKEKIRSKKKRETEREKRSNFSSTAENASKQKKQKYQEKGGKKKRKKEMHSFPN